MARMIQCVYLKKEAEGLEHLVYPAGGPAHLPICQQGSLAIVVEAPDHAGERKPTELG